jgi:hypothetical protein
MYNGMKMYGGVKVEIHAFLTSAWDGSERSASHPGHFTPGLWHLTDRKMVI